MWSADNHDFVIYLQAGLPDMEQCLQHATSLQQQNSDVFNCVRYYLLSTSPDVGLQLGLQYVKGHISVNM